MLQLKIGKLQMKKQTKIQTPRNEKAELRIQDYSDKTEDTPQKPYSDKGLMGINQIKPSEEISNNIRKIIGENADRNIDFEDEIIKTLSLNKYTTKEDIKILLQKTLQKERQRIKQFIENEIQLMPSCDGFYYYLIVNKLLNEVLKDE